MAVVAVFSPAGSSCFTLATVGVIGNVLTGTCRVSAVTTLVSAFTCSKCVRAGNFFDNFVFTLLEVLGEEVTLVTVAVQVSVTIFSSDLIFIPPVSILTLGWAGGR